MAGSAPAPVISRRTQCIFRNRRQDSGSRQDMIEVTDNLALPTVPAEAPAIEEALAALTVKIGEWSAQFEVAIASVTASRAEPLVRESPRVRSRRAGILAPDV